jgi:DNA-binding NtrC family response regulator
MQLSQLEARGRCVSLIEDDPVMGGSLAQRLKLEGYEVDWRRDGREAVARVSAQPPGAVICDIRLPDLSGEEIFNALRPRMPGTPFIFITAYGQIDQAVRLVKAGAADYLAKPFDISVLLGRLGSLLLDDSKCGQLGCSPAMRRIEATLRRVADLDSTLLIGGETGVGKEVAARLAHAMSRRSTSPFVAVNCAAIPDTLIESELFGHEKGAFTGADRPHEGYLERARDGTLFLDEIGDLPLGTQTRLLRVLQERAFHRLGSARPIPLRARVMCATHVALPKAIEAGRFRRDLYYRIAVIPLDIPPLRERRPDILPLIRLFIAEFSEAFGRSIQGVTAEAEYCALEYDWVGNVRELRNRVERAVALAETAWISQDMLFPEMTLPQPMEAVLPSLSSVVARAERHHIERVLAETNGQVEEAAKVLNISRSTLFEKLRRFRQ